MEGEYRVLRGGQTVGRCTVQRAGLYCCFSCRCRPGGEDVYRLWIEIGGERQEIGVMVPSCDGLCLDKRIAAKRFPPGVPTFTLRCRQEKPDGIFVPVCPEEPFAYLSRLQKAFLEIRDGQIGIVIPE